MARTSWFDEKAEHPVIQERVEKLESFTNALADGVVSSRSWTAQESASSAAMKALEAELSDEPHAQVTTVLVELSAYNVMRAPARAAVRARQDGVRRSLSADVQRRRSADLVARGAARASKFGGPGRILMTGGRVGDCGATRGRQGPHEDRSCDPCQLVTARVSSRKFVAFGPRCIPPGGVAPRSNMPNILGRRALPRAPRPSVLQDFEKTCRGRSAGDLRSGWARATGSSGFHEIASTRPSWI